MSEIINNSENRKALLKHMIIELHKGEAPDLVRARLVDLLKSIPYNDVVQVEQELINEGLPAEEVLKFCDIHTLVLDGHIDQSAAKTIPAGHPVDTFKNENVEILKVVKILDDIFSLFLTLTDAQVPEILDKVKAQFNLLSDIEKHYQKKENLVFPFLEKYGVTGPPKVMWGKHDEVRASLKASMDALNAEGEISADDLKAISGFLLSPTLKAISDMIMKEEEILFPMCMDQLSDEDWYHIYHQTVEIGYCLFDPQVEWKPEGISISDVTYSDKNSIQLPTGKFDAEELEALFSTLPIDITFVDKNDKVKFFSLGPDRIFTRTRAIIGRDVRMCHPPSSVHIVEQILADFKSSKESNAAFWINMKGRFIYIEYFALRNKSGEYLGTIEFTQDLTHVRKLEGEQRLLSYGKK